MISLQTQSKKEKSLMTVFNKYYLKKISYNFLPNELNNGISNSLELNDDIEFIRSRLRYFGKIKLMKNSRASNNFYSYVYQ